MASPEFAVHQSPQTEQEPSYVPTTEKIEQHQVTPNRHASSLRDLAATVIAKIAPSYERTKEARRQLYDLADFIYQNIPRGDKRDEAIAEFMDGWETNFNRETGEIEHWHIDTKTGKREEEYRLDIQCKKLSGDLVFPSGLQITELTCYYNPRLTSLDVGKLVQLIVPNCRDALSVALVRVRRVELLSQPWEGHIIAVIRYPRYEIV